MKITSSNITTTAHLVRRNGYVAGTIQRKITDKGKFWFPKVYSYNLSSKTPKINFPFKTKKLAIEFLAEVSVFTEVERILITALINRGTHTPAEALEEANSGNLVAA